MKKIIFSTIAIVLLIGASIGYATITELRHQEEVAKIYDDFATKGLWVQDGNCYTTMYIQKTHKFPVFTLDDGTSKKSPLPRFSISVQKGKTYLQLVDDEAGVISLELNKLVKEYNNVQSK